MYFARVLGEIAVLEVNALDLFAREVTGAVTDGEAAFGRAVDQVRSGAEVSGECGIFLDQRESSRRSAVAVLADELVDGGVFAELMHSGSEHDELGSVGQSHAGAVDALVAEPGAAELVRIEEDDGLFDLAVEHLEVDLERERGGEVEALDVVADVEAADDELSRCIFADDGLHVDDGQVARRSGRWRS